MFDSFTNLMCCNICMFHVKLMSYYVTFRCYS
jgi:hypothetical protein